MSDGRTTVYCSRCEREVDVSDQLTLTIPPMLPSVPEVVLLSNAGHACDPADLTALAISALVGLGGKRG